MANVNSWATAGGIFGFYAALSAKITCIWLSVWAIRKKSEVDYPLDSLSRSLRWGVVLLGFAIGYFAAPKYLRLLAAFIGLAFLCWPNFAYHTAHLWRSCTGAR